MVSLENGSEALAYSTESLAVEEPKPPSVKLANKASAAAGKVAGLIASAAWWPAMIILAAGAGGAALVSRYAKRVKIVEVPRLAAALPAGATKLQGIARKLGDTVKSLGGGQALVEEIVIRKNTGVLLRRVSIAPFVLEAGERIVVAGCVRITTPAKTRLVRRDDLEALAIPASLGISGDIEIATIRDGDRITVTGTPSIEVVREFAFHRDAGEATVMRGIANAVVAIAREDA